MIVFGFLLTRLSLANKMQAKDYFSIALPFYNIAGGVTMNYKEEIIRLIENIDDPGVLEYILAFFTEVMTDIIPQA